MESFANQVNKYPIVGDGLPLTNEYLRTLESAVVDHQDGVILFEGCRLHLNSRDDVWISPVLVTEDNDEDAYFNVLYIGVDPQSRDALSEVPVHVDLTTDVDLKLSSDSHGPLTKFMSLVDEREKAVIIRQCSSGMAFYPNVAKPRAYDKTTLQGQLDRLGSILGLPTVEAPSMPTRVLDSGAEPKLYHIDGNPIFAYEYTLDDDPWKYYNIFSAQRLEDISKNDLLVRIDSGCDIGQLYDDTGCDCREQLHTALRALQGAGDGVIVHIPAQDGRGYGAAVIDMIVGIERGDLPQRTIEGANDGVSISAALLGEQYDNRTYQGVGRILLGMDVETVLLQTDNRLKKEGLEMSGIKVARLATNTTGANGSMQGVLIKHTRTGNYIVDDTRDD